MDTDKHSSMHFQKQAEYARLEADIIDQTMEKSRRKRKVGNPEYTGDVALSTRLDTGNLNTESSDDLDSTAFELQNRAWFMGIIGESNDNRREPKIDWQEPN